VYGVDEINMSEMGRGCRIHGRMRNSYIRVLVGI
jgi:translation initiation factor IF-1